MEHCLFVKNENIVELGFVREYGRNRLDLADGYFFYEFWAASAIIKNIPTPYFINTDSPPIVMSLINGTGRGEGNVMGVVEFYLGDNLKPAKIQQMGVAFNEAVYDNKVVKTLDTFFVPGTDIFNKSELFF